MLFINILEYHFCKTYPSQVELYFVVFESYHALCHLRSFFYKNVCLKFVRNVTNLVELYTVFIKPGASMESRHFRTGQKKYLKCLDSELVPGFMNLVLYVRHFLNVKSLS